MAKAVSWKMWAALGAVALCASLAGAWWNEQLGSKRAERDWVTADLAATARKVDVQVRYLKGDRPGSVVEFAGLAAVGAGEIDDAVMRLERTRGARDPGLIQQALTYQKAGRAFVGGTGEFVLAATRQRAATSEAAKLAARLHEAEQRGDTTGRQAFKDQFLAAMPIVRKVEAETAAFLAGLDAAAAELDRSAVSLGALGVPAERLHAPGGYEAVKARLDGREAVEKAARASK